MCHGALRRHGDEGPVAGSGATAVPVAGDDGDREVLIIPSPPPPPPTRPPSFLAGPRAGQWRRRQREGGGIIRTALPNMDRETRDQYVLVIQAKDMVGQMGGLSGTTSVTITLTDVNDNPPRFTHKSYQNTVLESLPVRSVVARVKAADADVGANAEMDYRLMDGDHLGVFNISTDEETQEGVIVLLRTKSSFSPAYGGHQPQHRLSTSELPGRSVRTAVSGVTVEGTSNEALRPLLRGPAHQDGWCRRTPRTGTSIGRVLRRHRPGLQPTAPYRYSIDRNTDLERFFNVDALSGVISTAKPLDREANSVHNLTLLAIESRK
ncbi:hypothetical protein CRUP_013237 [Coryphaenoides rupestris]|nr:hypothetical protein CRUP_013237 [Coryphaenoides rupestris]